MMRTRKRTQSRNTPPTSPAASTSHTSGDQHQHQHLRHTGPSISTRARTGTASSKPSPISAQPESDEGSSIRKKSDEKKLSPPGTRTPFSTFIYALLVCVLLLLGWYIYRMLTLLERLKDEVGWWDIVVGDSGTEAWRGPVSADRFARGDSARRGDLEGSLNALADALGISSVQVALAVKPLIPPASLTSIVSKEGGRDSSEAVRLLIEDTTRFDNDGKGKEEGGI